MRRGFTLLELAVVLAIVALIIGGTMATLTASAQQMAYNSTIATMNAIEQALYNFATAYGRIPCPSDPRLKPTDTYYGVEAGNNSPGPGVGVVSNGNYVGECITSMTPAASLGTSTTAEEGGVPTRALKLPDTYMYDGWGHKIRYAVDPNYTIGVNNTNNLTTSEIPGAVCSSSSSRPITVYDASGGKRTSSAVYTLISQGTTGHGAYTMYGGTTLFNANNSNADTQKNCNCNGTAVSNTAVNYSPTYTQASPYYTTGHNNDPTYYFDDIVSFREPWQMVNPLNGSTGSSVCLPAAFWVVDGGNDRAFSISLTGSYQKTVGISATAGSNYALDSGATGSARDKYGNIWVTDGSRVMEYDATNGAWMRTLGGQYSSAGDNCAGVASGTTAVAISLYDKTHNSVPCLPTDSSCDCSVGGNNGEFSFGTRATGMAFDSAGNLWVTDPGVDVPSNGSFTPRIQEFNLSTGQGQYVTSFQVKDTNGHALIPSSIAISGSIIWVMIPGQTYSGVTSCGPYACNSSGTCVAPTGTGCGSASNQFSATGKNDWNSDYIALDSQGNLWINDEKYTKIMKFRNNGTNAVYDSTYTISGIPPSNLTGQYVDLQGGYIWVTNETNNSIYQVSLYDWSNKNTISTVNGLTPGAPQLSYFNAR